MRCVLLWALVAILCSPVDLTAVDDGLTTQESRMSDLIQSVVDRYLGQGRDSSALSLALLDAIQTEGVRSLLDEDDHSHDDEPPNASDKPTEKKKENLDVEKRDAPLPPPELFREMVEGGDFSNPLNTMYMEVAGQHRNCTKRKRRRKKPRLTRVGSESREPAPSFIVPGMTPQTQRALTEYSYTGVPPVGNVEIPRLTAEEQNYFDETTTRSSAYNSDGSLLSYGVTQRPGIIPIPKFRDETKPTAPPKDSSLKPKSNQHVSASSPLSSQKAEEFSVPSAYFALGSSTLFPPPATSRSNRRNPFEKLDRSTPLPRYEVHDPDALVPKRGKSHEREHTSSFTESPWANIDLLNRRIYDETAQDLNRYTTIASSPQGHHIVSRIPQVRPGPTTVAPRAQTDATRVHPEPASLTMLPRTTTTTSAPSRSSHATSTSAPNMSFRTAEPSQLRTLVPSSLNKGTLQHFSLYPKYTQVNTQSKIILAVGGARYSPLPADLVTTLGNNPGEAGDLQTPKSDYTNVLSSLAKPSFLSVAPIDDSRTIGTPLVELITKNGKMTFDHSSTDQAIKPKNDTIEQAWRSPAKAPPSGVLPISPKVISGQVLVFSSHNMPDESDDADETVTAAPPSAEAPPSVSNSSQGSGPSLVVDTRRTIMLQPIAEHGQAAQTHDDGCDHTHDIEDCNPGFESRSQTREDSGDTASSAVPEAKSPTTDGEVDARDDSDVVLTTYAPHPTEEVGVTSTPRPTIANATAVNSSMPQAPTIIMQVPAPEMVSDAAIHGYARGSARLHVPFVYHVHKTLQLDKNRRVANDNNDDEEDVTTDPDDKPPKRGASRTLISLPNNPFARLAPLKAEYYKYGKSPVKGYLPKSFLRLERLRNVNLIPGQHRSMLVFE